MEYKTKKIPLPDNREEITTVTKHPDFLCKDCVFMMYEGGGAEWNGQYEWLFMACKKQPTGYGWNNSVDPIADGPDDETSTSIITECTDYKKNEDHDKKDVFIDMETDKQDSGERWEF